MKDFLKKETTLTIMGLYGGAFVIGLAKLYRRGDFINKAKLEAAFPEYFEEYGENGKFKEHFAKIFKDLCDNA